MVARGASNAEIASELYLSPATVKTHVAAILSKLGLRDASRWWFSRMSLGSSDLDTSVTRRLTRLGIRCEHAASVGSIQGCCAGRLTTFWLGSANRGEQR
jgi:hypothetical protein